MKKLMIILAVSIGIAAITPAKASAQCCEKGKTSSASCHKTEQSSNAGSFMAKLSDSLRVYGKCGSCKARIEKAAKSVKGVTNAQWNQSTDMLVYAGDASVKKEIVSNAVLKVGHDTEFGKAPDKVYNSLPACCKYRK
jgi:periplasmic mercuric ion binding protein